VPEGGRWGEILNLRGTEQEDAGENCTTKGFMINMFHEMLFEESNQCTNKIRGTCSKHEKQDNCVKVPKGNGPLWRPSCKWGG